MSKVEALLSSNPNICVCLPFSVLRKLVGGETKSITAQSKKLPKVTKPKKSSKKSFPNKSKPAKKVHISPGKGKKGKVLASKPIKKTNTSRVKRQAKLIGQHSLSAPYIPEIAELD